LTGNDFETAFGTVNSTKATFTERLGRADPKPTNGEVKEQTVGDGAYKPYGFLPTGNIGETCDIQSWLENTETAQGIEVQYRFLMQVGYVGEEQLKLYLPDCIVVLEGRYLRDLRKKLARRQITFIAQYNPRVWPVAPAKGEPIIEKIEVVRPKVTEPNRQNS
jgi:hypothetical protein